MKTLILIFAAICPLWAQAASTGAIGGASAVAGSTATMNASRMMYWANNRIIPDCNGRVGVVKVNYMYEISPTATSSTLLIPVKFYCF